MAKGEFEFIREQLRPLAAHPAALELSDDAAVLDPPSGRQIVLTKDAMVAGVHFLETDPPDQIAQKLLRVNLSDLAAMGADPLGYLLALARPQPLDEAWLEHFCQGLALDQREFGTALLGGDLVSTPGPLTLSLTALGTVPIGQALRRSGARPGDAIWVSGTLGDAALGLDVLKGAFDPDAEERAFLVDRYRRPQPRIALGRALRGLASAALDVSDGLLADLGHIAETSRVGAVVETPLLPLSPAARALGHAALEAALSGGDDYELLFTVPPDRRAALDGVRHELAVALTRVGRIDHGAGVRALDAAGQPLALARAGWTHF